MNYILSIIIGLILGSFPTGYILLKKFKNIDITQNGSANVGALNSFKVSKSKLIALVVLLIDLLKGLVTVLLVQLLFGEEFIYSMLALIGAVLSHCYSFWIKFKGGRGLATAAGGALIISLPILGLWLLLWLIAFAFRRNVHFGNFTATILTAALSFTSTKVLIGLSKIKAGSELEFSILVSIMMLIITSRHIQVIKDYFQSKSLIKRND